MVIVVSVLLRRVTLAIPILAATIRLANRGTLSPGAQLLIEGVGIISALLAAWVWRKLKSENSTPTAFRSKQHSAVISGWESPSVCYLRQPKCSRFPRRADFLLELCRSRALLS
jgi:hypothetical protein